MAPLYIDNALRNKYKELKRFFPSLQVVEYIGNVSISFGNENPLKLDTNGAVSALLGMLNLVGHLKLEQIIPELTSCSEINILMSEVSLIINDIKIEEAEFADEEEEDSLSKFYRIYGHGKILLKYSEKDKTILYLTALLDAHKIFTNEK